MCRDEEQARRGSAVIYPSLVTGNKPHQLTALLTAAPCPQRGHTPGSGSPVSSPGGIGGVISGPHKTLQSQARATGGGGPRGPAPCCEPTLLMTGSVHAPGLWSNPRTQRSEPPGTQLQQEVSLFLGQIHSSHRHTHTRSLHTHVQMCTHPTPTCAQRHAPIALWAKSHTRAHSLYTHTHTCTGMHTCPLAHVYTQA